MRWIGRLLVICLLASSLWIWVRPVVVGLWGQSRSIARSMDHDMANSFFPLSSERWLTFDIPKNSTLFRFYAHAALKNDVGENTASYVIDYQWLDQQGVVLEERQHHITTRASATRPMENLTDHEAPSRQRFYDHQRSIPSSDHALYFNATTYPEATSLRLKASSTEEYIDQIGIRPYQQFQRLPE